MGPFMLIQVLGGVILLIMDAGSLNAISCSDILASNSNGSLLELKCLDRSALPDASGIKLV